MYMYVFVCSARYGQRCGVGATQHILCTVSAQHLHGRVCRVCTSDDVVVTYIMEAGGALSQMRRLRGVALFACLTLGFVSARAFRL